jgi:hypothetical protein
MKTTWRMGVAVVICPDTPDAPTRTIAQMTAAVHFTLGLHRDELHLRGFGSAIERFRQDFRFPSLLAFLSEVYERTYQ